MLPCPLRYQANIKNRAFFSSNERTSTERKRLSGKNCIFVPMKKLFYLIGLILLFAADTTAANSDFFGARVEEVAKEGRIWRTASEMREDVVTWATNYRNNLPTPRQLEGFNKACAASYRKADGTIETVFGRNGGVLNTQKSYPTISAEKGLGLHEELAKRLPLETQWPNPANCAECDAVNQALYNGAKWEDIQIHTITISRDGKMTDVIRCEECQDIFKNMYVTSE